MPGSVSEQQKASIQIQGLFNIIAQREQGLSRQIARDSLRQTEASLQLGEATRWIAEDSRRDNTSMKAIAAVTMFFLPGTFVASLFSMPIFRWNSDSGNDVVSHLGLLGYDGTFDVDNIWMLPTLGPLDEQASL